MNLRMLNAFRKSTNRIETAIGSKPTDLRSNGEAFAKEVYSMKLDFQAMTTKELKAYLLEHRSDTEAFHTLMDKIKAEPNPVWYKPEDTDRFSEIYEAHRNRDREQS
jgi:hypothetical protein